MAMTAAVISRLEKKDKMIAKLRERIETLKTKSKGGRTSARAASQPGDTSSSGKGRRPATSKARTPARARSAGRRKSVAPAATA
jgi:hypothetical protein